ncbi:probable regulator of reproduction DopA [Rhynchosporium agropyri]|uniref:Probable regulator of reproduction DopA n=1 Tax=Rhynchosporium agropyri TaxID=914238 RepID=A0A1E1K989_9HELO|nr:probable regulator of reproduction DopA [Rhynchosporium agropyri]
MALEAGRQSVSPTSSGRASPVPRKWRNQLGSDEPPSKDKAFRRYASGVERSLSLFDTALQEWADYISFLGRLLKSLQAHPKDIIAVPSKAIVAKRLAQCLNPSLPSGVHQKALEVYSFIFSMIGRDSLSNDLPLYLPGLSSTLSFASLSVRSPFLDLLEKHLLKLDPRSLRPALKAIILALLPGLEEENSEEFERTLKLLDGFKHALRPPSTEDLGENHSSGDEYFWQCFFLAAITSNGRRQGALSYLARNLPKLGQPLSSDSTTASANGSQKEEESAERLGEIVTSPEPGLLLRCFAAGLGDEQLLIQRGFLDLLVTHLPLHSHVLQKRVKSDDLELLITAAAGVVSRREMSLNRRLWTWLLGPEPTGNDGEGGPDSPTSATDDPLGLSSSPRTRYFQEFGLQPLVQALLKLVARDSLSAVERARPFRICLSLMDRWEIGGLVVPDIFLSVVDSVRKYKDVAATTADFSEVLRSASVFFDGVESGLIWGEIIGLIVQAIGAGELSTAERVDKLSLVKFIIAHFNVREEEMLMVHAPLTTLTLLTLLEDAKARSEQQPNHTGTLENVTRLALTIAVDLIDLIPERAFQTRPSTRQSTISSPDEQTIRQLTNSEILRKIKKFYVQDQGNLDAFSPPYSSHDVSDILMREVCRIICQSLSDSVSSADAGIKSKLLVMLISKVPKTDSLNIPNLVLSIERRLNALSQLPFLTFNSIISLTTNLYSASYLSAAELSKLVSPLVRHAWSYLSASHPKYHVETVRCLWQLQTALTISSHEIEAAICSLMIEQDTDGTFAVRNADPGRSFTVLWTHTMQDTAAHIDRRASKTSAQDSKGPLRLLGTTHYEVMLARPLFLLLDSLLDERTQLFITVRTWLQSLVGIERIFHLFISKFSTFTLLQTLSEEGSSYQDSTVQTCSGEDDIDQCLYYLRTVSNMLRWSSDSMWAALAESSISTDTSHSSLYRITGRDGEIPLLEFFLHVCLRAIACSSGRDGGEEPRISQLHRTALTTLHQILLSPYSLSFAEFQLENVLIIRLEQSLNGPDPFIQVLLLDVVFDALKLRNTSRLSLAPPLSPTSEQKRSLVDTPQNSRPSLTTEHDEQFLSLSLPPPPLSLVKCLEAGFAAPSSRSVLDSWVSFLTECLPFYSDSIFQILIPLVETLCAQVGSAFGDLQGIFKDSAAAADVEDSTAPESTLISLLNGLEHVLARGHDRLLQEEMKTPQAKSPEQPQGFFGNMVSGVFASETPQSRSATANNRLTVLLSFQDAVRICFVIWSWGGKSGSKQDTASAASFNYTSLRMRNRARRLLEHLFAAEALECLETVVEIWQKSSIEPDDPKSPVVLNLLHVLDGSRPKHTIPAIFNAIYSRTNPSALEPTRKSTLTASLSDTNLVVFLVEYARSLEDDAMDEIWTDCMTFLKDILANPFPHRQTLPSLLEFAAILGEKVDNTNFGEQRKMRRELGDLFLRLLAAIFTTRPMGFADGTPESDERSLSRPDDIVGILASIAPNLPKVLVEPDRILAAANTISASVIGPTFKSRSFPDNISKSTLILLYQLSRLPNTQKTWKKDISDAFNDARFFANSVALIESDWLPLLMQWTLSDKDRMPEFLSRLLPPSTAGIVFGVGATSARLEADRKTQLNLRRVATLILATMNDNFAGELPLLQEKIVELLAASTTSSPSSTTRADIYLLLRAIALKTSAVHLATLWPIVNAELHAAISSVVSPDHSAASETFNNQSVLQACKLLDTLLCIAPDDFQLHEWLFITDTIDAVYRPSHFHPVALIDELSEELGSTALSSATHTDSAAVQAAHGTSRRPLIGPGGISDEGTWERKDELVGKVLRPYFSQLSIFAFESTYSMSVPDWEACRMGLLKDLFDERSIVKAL